MTRRFRDRWRPGALAAAALLAAAGPGAFAQVNRPPDAARAAAGKADDAPPPLPGDLEGDDNADPNNMQIQNVVMFADENFDQWVFGGRNASAAKSRMDSLLTMKIEEVEKTCGINEAQKAKLRLAGRGDVKRFFDRVEDKRKKFQAVKNDQNKVNEIFQEIQPLQVTLAQGPFGEGSIFLKSLKRSLDPGQSEKYERVEREKQLFRYRAKVDLVVAMLDNAVGFNADQRRKFAKLLVEQTKPPRKFGQWDYQVVLLQASRLPADKVKPLFDDAQWRALGQQFEQAKGMETFLLKNGFLAEDDLPKNGGDAKADTPKADKG